MVDTQAIVSVEKLVELLHPLGHVLHSAHGPICHAPQKPQEGDAGVAACHSLAEVISPGAGRLPGGQDHLLGEEAGDRPGLLRKYIELVTSAGPQTGWSVGLVMEIGDGAVRDLGMEGRWDKMEEWLKGLTFLSSISGKDDYDYFHHFVLRGALA